MDKLEVIPLKSVQPLHFVSKNLLAFNDKTISLNEIKLEKEKLIEQDKVTCIKLFKEYFEKY